MRLEKLPACKDNSLISPLTRMHFESCCSWWQSASLHAKAKVMSLTLNSSWNISLFSGEAYTARPSGRSLLRPKAFFTKTVSPRPPSSTNKDKHAWNYQQKNMVGLHWIAVWESLIVNMPLAGRLTRNSLCQDEFHFFRLIGVLRILHKSINAMSGRVEPRGASFFWQWNLPPSFNHNCVLE